VLDHRVSRERFKVAIPIGRQRSGLRVTTIAIGADVPTSGKDERRGIAITIHAVGTTIRRESPKNPFPPEAVLGLGASR
jgi:hypothetical protein